jgi:hypothetical protein
LRREIVHDLQFLDDNDQVKTTFCLTEFTLKATTLSAHLMKR